MRKFFAVMMFISMIILNWRNPGIKVEASETLVYVEETFEVTYIVKAKWDDNIVEASIEIENTGAEIIENWFLGMSIDGDIKEIWNATIHNQMATHYVIKNDVHNSDIEPGEKVSFGCIIAFNNKDIYPEEFYMPMKTEVVNDERYEIKVEVISDWGEGKELEISILNKSKQEIENWSMECDLKGEILSLWNGNITANDNNHYSITNSDYNRNIPAGGNVSIGCIVTNGDALEISNVILREVVFNGITVAEKLVDDKNFDAFGFITKEYEVTPLYTIRGQISAYLIQYYCGEEAKGYIIVSNEVDCPNYYIEFGYGSPNMINDMIAMLKESEDITVERIIYAGGYTYYALAKDIVYSVNSLGCRAVTSEEEAMINAATSDVQYYEKGVSLSLADVYAKEVGYANMYPGVAPNVPHVSTFKTTNETATAYYGLRGETIDNHCGPTAGLNMLLYLDYQGYTSLELSGTSWKNAFCRLCDDMKVCANNTTYDTDVENTFSELFSEAEVTRIYSIAWEDACDYLDESAVLFVLVDSQIYGNHWVLGVGYSAFEFTSGWTSRYLKIIDGWTKDNRYVNYSLGIDHIGAVAVEFETAPIPAPTPAP